MITALIKNKYTIHWLVFHIALGFISTITIIPLVAWFYAVLISGLVMLFTMQKSSLHLLILFLMVYLGAFELVARMAKASPIIPYELSKYIYSFLLLVGIIEGGQAKSKGWVMFFLLLPATLFDLSGLAIGYQPIAFNLLGPLNVALAIIYLSNKKIEEKNFIILMRVLIYAFLLSLIFTIIKTPDFDEIEFNLRANFSTTGGFGSNQVSSVFGLGMFIMFVAWVLKWRLLKSVYLDIILILVFAFQGVLTFSRGGMFGGILAILVFLLLSLLFAQLKEKKKIFKLLQFTVISFIVLFAGFIYADNLTGGMLSLRYQGHTEGTAAGTKEQTLNNITSNRLDIFLGDIQLWSEHPIIGVGIGGSRYMRSKVEGVIAHVELSRLMAEHGILGLIYFILLLQIGYSIYLKAKFSHQQYYYICVAFFVLAIFTTFHASMRTFLTPLLISLSILNIVPNKRKI